LLVKITKDGKHVEIIPNSRLPAFVGNFIFVAFEILSKIEKESEIKVYGKIF